MCSLVLDVRGGENNGHDQGKGGNECLLLSLCDFRAGFPSIVQLVPRIVCCALKSLWVT